ncbi:unnamed protein product [Bursaphelenchus xylophilus]|uniref:(pine wood nematode) hypothetical protein n=1 Tax=Bursaphelenchus xylophilus TaxID=6326 RepID=A0A1I7S7U1_BURXY|nr:unnamed protein product [Bursaphelenchus xylophilus]CAG9087019.1 unnamed protein product [Bursaphelenchus xylophilus]
MHIGNAILSCLLLLDLTVVEALFAPLFREFLKLRFGSAWEQRLTREDLVATGWDPSFGGGSHVGGERTRKTPIIFAPCWQCTADFFAPIVNFFRENNYTDAEMYGTTVGELQKGRLYQPGYKCEYVESFRQLIKAVMLYTNTRIVHILAFSYSGALTRKAILGGKCVDKDFDLGPPLTQHIDVYLSVAGVQQGALFCENVNDKTLLACNMLTGMKCGSRFLQDINSVKHYEGKRPVIIETTADEMVGIRVCGRFASQFAGAEIIRVNKLSHVDVLMGTMDVQLGIFDRVQFDYGGWLSLSADNFTFYMVVLSEAAILICGCLYYTQMRRS